MLPRDLSLVDPAHEFPPEPMAPPVQPGETASGTEHKTATRRIRRVAVWALAGTFILVATAFAALEVWANWQERSARRAYDEEDYDSAEKHALKALRIHSERFAANFLLARIERARRAYPEAEKYLLRCKELEGMTPELQMELLLLRCEKGSVDELAPQLLAAVNDNHPDSAAILEAMALVYMRQARYPVALTALDRWIERDPNSARALDWRGWVCNQMDRRGQAIDDYSRALELQPNRKTVRLRLAELLIESSRHAEALPHVEILYRTQPDDQDVLACLAACRIVQLRRDEARSLLDRVLAMKPDHFSALVLLGNLDREDGRFAESERLLRKAVELKPLDPGTRYALYSTLMAQPDRQKDAEFERNRWEQDRDATSRIIQLFRGQLTERPNDPDLAAEAGELLLRQGETQLGLFWLNKALQLNPQHARSHKALAGFYERQNDPVRAELHRKQLVGGGNGK